MHHLPYLFCAFLLQQLHQEPYNTFSSLLSHAKSAVKLKYLSIPSEMAPQLKKGSSNHGKCLIQIQNSVFLHLTQQFAAHTNSTRISPYFSHAAKSRSSLFFYQATALSHIGSKQVEFSLTKTSCI